MSTFTLTLDGDDFARASDLFQSLADAFRAFRSDTGGAVAKFKAKIADAYPQPGEPQPDPAGEPAPAAEAKTRKPRAAKAEAAAPVAGEAESAEAPAVKPAPAGDAAKSDDELLVELRALGNDLVAKHGGPAVMALLQAANVRKYPELDRAGRIAMLGNIRAKLAA